VLNIAGHRQVTPGHTICPGDALIALLPGMRQQVKARLSAVSISSNGSTYPVVDELGPGFIHSNAIWHDAYCGDGGHTYYTYAVSDPAQSTNTAIWRPSIPTTGNYHVYVHVPQQCHLAMPPYASQQACYTITYAGGQARQWVDHNTAAEWVDLGSYRFKAGTSGSVTLSDLTGESFSLRRVVFFDAVKWVPAPASHHHHGGKAS